MNIRNRVAPTPIQVNPSQRWSTVANHNTIRINDWYKFDYVIIQYRVILSIIATQLVYYMTHDEAPMRLCSMKSCLNVDALPFPISKRSIWCLLFGESELIDVETTNALSYYFLSKEQIIVDQLEVFPFFFLFALSYFY